jgi:hypothetical protein
VRRARGVSDARPHASRFGNSGAAQLHKVREQPFAMRALSGGNERDERRDTGRVKRDREREVRRMATRQAARAIDIVLDFEFRSMRPAFNRASASRSEY